MSAAHAGKSKGVDPSHLSKIWKIDFKTAERTVEVVSQKSKRTDDSTLSRNYGTNDRMLRCKRINECFFTDTFFSTKKAGKSSRGNICCQRFVTDKGFVYVVPIKSKAEGLQAVKQFAKEIGAPDAVICDMASEQTSPALKRFCQEIGTTQRVSRRRTPLGKQSRIVHWINKGGSSKVHERVRLSPCFLGLLCRAQSESTISQQRIFLRYMHEMNAHTALTGEDGDIFNLCQYKWYDWCYFREQK